MALVDLLAVGLSARRADAVADRRRVIVPAILGASARCDSNPSAATPTRGHWHWRMRMCARSRCESHPADICHSHPVRTSAAAICAAHPCACVRSAANVATAAVVFAMVFAHTLAS
eukprot:4020796-Prymnesium_polylepis.1